MDFLNEVFLSLFDMLKQMIGIKSDDYGEDKGVVDDNNEQEKDGWIGKGLIMMVATKMIIMAGKKSSAKRSRAPAKNDCRQKLCVPTTI